MVILFLFQSFQNSFNLGGVRLYLTSNGAIYYIDVSFCPLWDLAVVLSGFCVDLCSLGIVSNCCVLWGLCVPVVFSEDCVCCGVLSAWGLCVLWFV